jgi:YidC/Oxa1 family membrane protein insertase
VYNDKDQVEKLKMSDIDDKLWMKPALFGTENQYFINALVADDDGFLQRGYFTTENNTLTTILEGPKVEEETSWTLSFYCGPKESQALSAVDVRLEETLDYGFFAPVSKMLMYLLRIIYDYIGNYGWAIIILTILVRLIMVPFTLKSEQSTKNMRELDRRMKGLDKKYNKDSEELKTEKAKLMRTHGMPAGFGCLIPFLLQVPIFLGLSNALRSSIELYKAPFVFWIQDLSVPDPYYILPLLVFVGFMANALNAPDTRQRMSLAVAGIVFIAVVTKLAAGLTLYIACSILAGVAQSYITKKMKAA